MDHSFDNVMDRLRAGDGDAAAEVFHRFAHRLIALARSRLDHLLRAKVDPEDVMQSVYRSFFRRQAADGYEFAGWDGLWGMLTIITLRKCGHRAEYFHAVRRDVRREAHPNGDAELPAIAGDPTPSHAARLAETVEQVMRGLEERERDILALSLQGYDNAEISAQVGRTERTIQRVLKRIREGLERMRGRGRAMSLEQVIDRFEDAWQRGAQPEIDAHLPADDDRLPALVELVHIDLERRLKAGEDARVESYLQRYPDLADASILVELAAAEFQLRRRRDPSVAIEEYSRRFPQLNGAIAGFTIPAPPAGTPPSTLTHPSSGDGVRSGPVVTESSYRDLRPYAKGGLGEILVARDGVLNREVALKFLRGRRDPEALGRFLREAEITGRLEHPGVVPVYGLGHDAAGNPVYAMRFIRGQTLHEAIDRYHADAPKLRAGPRRLAFRNLLARFLSVCNTVAYAHKRGVIHRDLKPGNILLGEFGETLVVDWGLAKETGNAELGTGNEETTASSGFRVPGSALDTMAGEVIGTPAYMSPEQAGGEVERVGAASDIYSLGVVLYTLLTGRPPFAPGGVRETLEKVRRGDFVPPRQLYRRLPQPLEAICLKAMATEPARRYSSALALARDLERWLASEPVSAWREPMIVTARRWLSRHPTFAASGSVAAIAVGLLAIVTAVWRAERADRRFAELQGEQHRKELARHDSDEYLNHVAQAGRSWLKGDRDGLLRHLEACKPELRQWEWQHLHRHAAVEPRVLKSHTKEAWAVAYSHDGSRLASAGLDGAVHVWDTTTGAKLLTLPTNGQPVWALAFHPDGTRLATGGDDCVARIWDLRTKKESTSFEMQVEIGDIAFSPDGKRLAAATMPGRIKGNRIGPGQATVWDLASGVEVAALRGHSSGIHSIAFAPDGRLGTAGLDGLTQIWHIDKKEAIHKLRAANHLDVLRVAFSPDGKHLATSHGSGAVLIWDANSGQLNHTMLGHNATAWGAAFSPDGRWLATSSDDFTIRVWDAKRGRLSHVLRGHARGIANVAWRPDGAQIASASDDGTVRLWSPDNPGAMQVLTEHTDAVRDVAVSDDGRLAASAGDDGAVRVWDLASPKQLLSLSEKDRLTCVAFQRGGDLLAYSGVDGVLRLWNAKTRREERRWSAHAAAVWAVAFSPDGAWIATASADHSVRLWRVSDGEPARTLSGHEGPVNHVAFSADGHWIGSAGADKAVHLWDAATGELRHKLTGFTSAVRSVAFAPDGQTLVAGSDYTPRVVTGEPGQIKLFNVATGEELSAWPGHPGGVTGLVFSADGTRLFSAGGEGSFKVWDRASGQELLSLPAHAGRGSTRLALPASGSLLTAGPDGNVILWRAGE